MRCILKVLLVIGIGFTMAKDKGGDGPTNSSGNGADTPPQSSPSGKITTAQGTESASKAVEAEAEQGRSSESSDATSSESPDSSSQDDSTSDDSDSSSPVPEHTTETLDYLREHGVPPPGHGLPNWQGQHRPFQNRDEDLPTEDADGDPITYSEYDVHPYQPGVNRGPERLVIGSDGRAWYTDDHYSTFTPIDEQSDS